MGVVFKIKSIALTILIISIGVFGIGCSKNEDISTIEEIDLSDEIKIIEAFGLVKADETTDVIIDFPAKVLEVIVEEGHYIGLNDPILSLDLFDYHTMVSDKRNELNIARLEYQRADASLKGLSIENIDLQLSKLSNDLELAKKSYEQTLEEHNSREELYKIGGISKENLQQSKLSLDEVLNKVESIEYEQQLAISRYDREKEQLGTKRDTERYQVSIQDERIKQIENSLVTLEAKIDKPYIIENQIVSEYENAAVYDIKYTSGSMVDTTLKAFSIVNLDSLIIEANIVEEFIRDVELGSSVRIVPIADRAREYTGKVIYISQMAFTNNGETEIPIKISIDNIDSFLLPNYNVDVFIDVQ